MLDIDSSICCCIIHDSTGDNLFLNFTLAQVHVFLNFTLAHVHVFLNFTLARLHVLLASYRQCTVMINGVPSEYLDCCSEFKKRNGKNKSPLISVLEEFTSPVFSE